MKKKELISVKLLFITEVFLVLCNNLNKCLLTLNDQKNRPRDPCPRDLICNQSSEQTSKSGKQHAEVQLYETLLCLVHFFLCRQFIMIARAPSPVTLQAVPKESIAI